MTSAVCVAATSEDCAEVVANREHAGMSSVEGGRVGAVLKGRDVVRPRADDVAVFSGDVEHVADHE